MTKNTIKIVSRPRSLIKSNKIYFNADLAPQVSAMSDLEEKCFLRRDSIEHMRERESID